VLGIDPGEDRRAEPAFARVLAQPQANDPLVDLVTHRSFSVGVTMDH